MGRERDGEGGGINGEREREGIGIESEGVVGWAERGREVE